MNKFDPAKLLELARPVLNTEYARNADWRASFLVDIVNGIEEDFDDNEIIAAVENLAYADETVPMPPS